MGRVTDAGIDEAECGCCWFVVGSHYVSMACGEHGGGSNVVEMYDDAEDEGAEDG